MATLTVDGPNRRVVAVLQGGDAQPASVVWTSSPIGYLKLRPSDAAGPGMAVDVTPLQPGVVAVTATFLDASGNQLNPPAPATQNVAVTGTSEEAMAIASSASVATTPYSAQAHQDAFGPTPTVAAGAANGGSPPNPVADANGSDISGFIAFGTGTGPTAGAQVVVTFNAPWPAPPPVKLTASNAATQALGIEVTNVTATEFTISTTSAPAADQPLGTYEVGYQVGD